MPFEDYHDKKFLGLGLCNFQGTTDEVNLLIGAFIRFGILWSKTIEYLYIPARGSSVYQENIRLFHGKPMISWAIEKALSSQCFDKIIVSTDDSEIAATAIESGAEVPFLRPTELSDDYTSTQAVIQHAINSVPSIHLDSFLCCLYPTVPFLVPADINKCFDLLASNSYLIFVPVVSFLSRTKITFD